MQHIKTHLRTKYTQVIRAHLAEEKTRGNMGNTKDNSNTTSSTGTSHLQQLIDRLRKNQAIQTPLIGSYIADATR